ncbi:uncharacterized protein LOC122266936 [Penaeus japonicus]|uniref:uncharacterized protein LOC122266936 n=1 Tax=Penaeus japonicus TaxID=27405 RepID=UPI001C70F48F|nr:uncharacterized protein LOC122266936 [Penaeus japonicus]
MTRVEMNVRGQTFNVEFEVFDYVYNLLGIDILCRFNCTLNLSQETLTFFEFREEETNEYLVPKMNVNINGKDVSAIVDTGTELGLLAPLDMVRDLGLPITDVPEDSSWIIQPCMEHTTLSTRPRTSVSVSWTSTFPVSA